jgi:hypothetical protein
MRYGLIRNRRFRRFVDAEFQLPHLLRCIKLIVLISLITAGLTVAMDSLVQMGNPDPRVYWGRMFSAMGAVLAAMLLILAMIGRRVSHWATGSGSRVRALVESQIQFRRLQVDDFRVRRTDFDRWLYDAITQVIRARDLRTTAYVNVLRRKVAEPLLRVAQAASEADRREIQDLAGLLMEEDRLFNELNQELSRAERERGSTPDA